MKDNDFEKETTFDHSVCVTGKITSSELWEMQRTQRNEVKRLTPMSEEAKGLEAFTVTVTIRGNCGQSKRLRYRRVFDVITIAS
jgi:hypothetical protein